MFVYAITSKNETTNKPVTFIVVAENEDRASWPVIALLGAGGIENYEVQSIQYVCEASTEKPHVLGCIGENASKPEIFQEK